MAHVTQCPACSTRFRVVDDQLKISEGWVRCGRCGEVFDGRQALVSLPDAPPSQAPVAPPLAPPASPYASPADAAHVASPSASSLAVSAASTAVATDALPVARFAASPAAPPPQAPAESAAPLPASASASLPAVLPAAALPEFPAAASPEPPAASLDPAPALRVPAPQNPSTAEVDIELDAVAGPAELPDAAALDIEIGDDGALRETTGAAPAAPAEAADGLAGVPVHTSQGVSEMASHGHDEVFATSGLGRDTEGAAQPGADSSAAGTVDQSALADADGRTAVTDATPSDPVPPPQVPVEVSFVRAARRQAFWAQTWVRAVLGLLALLLVLLLAGQVLWQERTRVAAAVPALKPWLVALCEPFGCDVGHWQHIESVRLDGTALVRLRDGAYRLEVGLNNTADLPVALPALELSLTNVRDEVVLRRVILPADWANPAEVLPPMGSVTLHVNLSVTDSETLHTAGYRALVFYP